MSFNGDCLEFMAATICNERIPRGEAWAQIIEHLSGCSVTFPALEKKRWLAMPMVMAGYPARVIAERIGCDNSYIHKLRKEMDSGL